jgi:putative oxidoreductase
MIFDSIKKDTNLGLLLLRLGAGLGMAVFHGWGKITGGTGAWAEVGGATALIGLDFAPAFWGFLAAFAEFAGGLLVAAGLLFRPALFLLICTMGMAATMHIMTGNGSPETALIYGLVFLVLFVIGPGSYSADKSLGL